MVETWKPEPQLFKSLVSAVPEILASQKPNGQFGTEPWICLDQNVILSLDAAVRTARLSVDRHGDRGLIEPRRRSEATRRASTPRTPRAISRCATKYATR